MDYELDYSHPILRKHKITGCWIDGSGFNLALKQMADVRDFSIESGDFSFPAASSTLCHQNVASSQLEIGAKRVTILAGYSNVTGSQEGSIFKTEYAADSDDRIYLYISDYWNSIRCGISSGAAVKYIDYIDPEVRDGNSHTCGVRRISDGELQLMFDGSLKGTTGVSLYSYINVDNLYIGNTGGLAFNFDGNIDFLYLFDTNLSDSEYKSLSDNPRQILKRTSANDSIYAALYPVSSTGLVVNTSPDSLTLSEQPSTIKLSLNVSSQADSLLLNEQLATVLLGSALTVNTSPDVITLSESVATIVDSLNLNAVPTSINLLEQLAKVEQGLTITTTSQGLVLTESLANIQTTLNTIINTTPVSLNISESIAEVLTKVDLNVDGDPDVLSLIEATATITIKQPATLDSIELQIEALTKTVNDMWQLMGLDINNPTTTTTTTADTGTIHQDITGDGVNTSTITRTS